MKKLTVEQIEKLKESPYVISANENQVCFTEEFKRLALRKWRSGRGPKSIFDKYDTGYNIIGKARVVNNLKRWKEQERRQEGFQRCKGSERPKAATFTSAEEVKYLKDQLEYQRQEI